MFSMQLIAGITFGTADSLIIASIVGLLFVCFALLVKVIPQLVFYFNKLRRERLSITWLLMRTFKCRFFDIRYQMPQSICNSIVNNSLIICVEFIFGKQIAGATLLAEKLIKMPVGVVVDTIRPLLIADFSKMNFEVFSKLKLTLYYALTLSFSFVIFIYLISEFDLLNSFQTWVKIKLIALPMGLFACSLLITTPITCLFYSCSESKLLLQVEICRMMLLLLLASLFYLVNISDVFWFYVFLSVGYTLIPLIGLIYFYYKTIPYKENINTL
ncbi:hypothetical protein ACLKMH_14450 [Psychromonas sp. KJ10-10]|uniref:hypothetical protein n=1 Tax=Psychromonas sp. KJ10-10 TaxID=3391823 RepID=UPI0039B61C5C